MVSLSACSPAKMDTFNHNLMLITLAFPANSGGLSESALMATRWLSSTYRESDSEEYCLLHLYNLHIN
jgi:hypothetical protein